jgi:hypothetical protein
MDPGRPSDCNRLDMPDCQDLEKTAVSEIITHVAIIASMRSCCCSSSSLTNVSLRSSYMPKGIVTKSARSAFT